MTVRPTRFGVLTEARRSTTYLEIVNVRKDRWLPNSIPCLLQYCLSQLQAVSCQCFPLKFVREQATHADTVRSLQ